MLKDLECKIIKSKTLVIKKKHVLGCHLGRIDTVFPNSVAKA